MKKTIYNAVHIIKHKFWVFYFISKFCCKLFWRGIVHDMSKFYPKDFCKVKHHIKDLTNTSYGTKEYNVILAKMKSSTIHHWKHNRHHPQHYENGFKDMTALDRIEMMCDWVAATKKHDDGDIVFSLEIGQNKFQYTDKEKEILQSYVDEIFSKEKQEKQKKLRQSIGKKKKDFNHGD